jgi:exopolyphosphatase/guanosine-5'-triphosphate,3'-diphosphate pyrophosphatase
MTEPSATPSTPAAPAAKGGGEVSGSGSGAGASQLAAAIDIGSSAVRMIVAQIRPDGGTEILEKTSRSIRLGRDVFVTGRLSQKSIGTAIAVLRDYRKMLDAYGVTLVRAVATSAVREADNSDAFLDRVSQVVGFNVDVIEPTEQSRLVVSAVLRQAGPGLDLRGRHALIGEVGAGGTVLTVLKKGEIAASESYDIGSVRVREMLGLDGQAPARAAELLQQHIANVVELARKSLGLRTVNTFIALGGEASFAAAQAGKPHEAGELSAVGPAELGALIKQCIASPTKDFSDRFGLAYAEAEMLLPALLVYQALLAATKADRMLVSGVSLREGLLLDLPRYVTGREDPALVESILLSARTLGEKYNYDPAHAECVADAAVRLFDLLQEEHGLKPRHRLLLRVAGLLHDIGDFVGNRAHHKHSHYLIRASELFGLRGEDVETVALVARYHRQSMPKSSHPEYAVLPREARMVVNKLAAILRTADALDRGHGQHAREVEFQLQGSDLVINARGAHDLTLERQALASKSDLLEEIFGLKARLEQAGGGDGAASSVSGRRVPSG